MAKAFEQIIPHFVAGISQQPGYLRHSSTSQDEVNTWPTFSQGLRKRPPTLHQAKLDHTASDALSTHIVSFLGQLFLVMIDGGQLFIWDKQGNRRTVTLQEGSDAYLAGTRFHCLPNDEYAYILNKSKKVAMSTGTKSQENPPKGPQALVFCRQFVPKTEYKVEILSEQGEVLGTFTYKHTDDHKDVTDSTHVMAKLFALWGSSKAAEAMDAKHQGSKILFTAKENKEFSLRVSDGQGDALLSLVKGTVKSISDLPNTAFDGFTVEVTKGGEDSYYLGFQEKTGTWQETVKPGLKNALDATTMPHRLTLNADGSFTFGPNTWVTRKAGNEDTAPEPSFVGVGIEDTFFYQGRLGILVTDSVIFSEVDAFDNFFPTSTATVVESDPVDVTIASGGATSSNATGGFPHLLYGAEVPKGDLLLFGRHMQYVASVEKTLTPQNLKVALHSHVECAPVRPVSLEQSVVFVSPTGACSQVKEFIPNRSEVSYLLAETLTEHVPHLLPKGIKKLITVNGQKLLLVLPHSSDAVYAYFYYWQADKRLQSAWTRWEFGSPILDVCATGQEVWFVFKHGGEVFLEKMTFAPDMVCLDHQLSLKGDYNNEHNRTKWTLPDDGFSLLRTFYNPLTQEEIEILTDDPVYPEGKGDMSGHDVVAGLPYEMRFTLGPFVVRHVEAGTVSPMSGMGIPCSRVTGNQLRLGVEGMRSDSLWNFSVEVKTQGRLSATYPYDRCHATSGNTFIVPLHGAAEDLEVTLLHKDIRSGAIIANAAWTGTYGDL